MQEMVSSFLEIAAGQSTETANQFLQATSWNLEEAIQLFYLGNEGNGGVASSSISPPADKSRSERENSVTNENVGEVHGGDEVRAPLPVKRETLYGDAFSVRLQPSSVIAFRNFDEESKQPAVWESDQSAASTSNVSRDNLASLYRPPFALMYQGTFDKAYNDSSEGKKVCTYYHLVSIPAILIIDPVTGQKMHAWNGMVQPDRLLEDLLPYMERGPKEHLVLDPMEHHVPHPLKCRREVSQDSTLHTLDETTEEDDEVALALAASMEGIKGPLGSPAKDMDTKTGKDAETSSNLKPSYPPLPEEPKASRQLCRIGVRLPDGRRVQRNFLRTDSIKLLWSFCYSLLEDGETPAFRFTQAIPGASKTLDYSSSQTFEEAGLSNSMLSMAWD